MQFKTYNNKISPQYDLFCDESSHLSNPEHNTMCIGYIKCSRDSRVEISKKIKSLRADIKNLEIKWNRANKMLLPTYKKLIDLFFESELEFRCVLIRNKHKLDYNNFEGGQEKFYYSMMYYLLIKPYENIGKLGKYRVFADIKDSWSNERLKKLKEVISNRLKGNSPFISFQAIRSEDSNLIQLCDLFIGIICYRSSHYYTPANDSVRNELVNYLTQKSGFQLNSSTYPNESKFNIFDFSLREPNG